MYVKINQLLSIYRVQYNRTIDRSKSLIIVTISMTTKNGTKNFFFGQKQSVGGASRRLWLSPLENNVEEHYPSTVDRRMREVDTHCAMWTDVYTMWTDVYTMWTDVYTMWTDVYTMWTDVYTMCTSVYTMRMSIYTMWTRKYIQCGQRYIQCKRQYYIQRGQRYIQCKRQYYIQCGQRYIQCKRQ